MIEAIILTTNLILLLVSFYFLMIKQRSKIHTILSYIALIAISFDHLYISNPFAYIALNLALTCYIVLNSKNINPTDKDAIALSKVFDSILNKSSENFSFKKSLKVSIITLVVFLLVVAAITTRIGV